MTNSHHRQYDENSRASGGFPSNTARASSDGTFKKTNLNVSSSTFHEKNNQMLRLIVKLIFLSS